jgi:hypothetical protein
MIIVIANRSPVAPPKALRAEAVAPSNPHTPQPPNRRPAASFLGGLRTPAFSARSTSYDGPASETLHQGLLPQSGVRIARARELLEEGESSQKQIAESLGYYDVASFARAFRNAAGTAQGACRDRHRGKSISPADVRTQDGTGQKKHRRPVRTRKRHNLVVG